MGTHTQTVQDRLRPSPDGQEETVPEVSPKAERMGGVQVLG